jgi:DNA helicase-2/ATP-dependent DNA helicase PcrA
MAEWIARDVRRRLDEGESPRQIAILYRTNRMAQVLEPALIAQGIPYHIAQGVDLFQRQEAQMLMAAVRAVLNPQDEWALRKLSALIEGVGEKTLERMFEEARVRDLPLIEGRNFLRGKAKDGLDDLARRLDMLSLWNPAHIGEWALSSECGNFAPWLKGLSMQAENPRASLQKRLNTLISIDQAIKHRLASMGIEGREHRQAQWAEVLAVGLGTPDEEVDQDAVTLSTIFKVKGLEFRHVHVAGFSEGLMPLVRKSAEWADEEGGIGNLEEERRLSYVAATRARETLHLHHADRIDWGFTVENYAPSRFAHEMGLEVQSMNVALPDSMPKETRRDMLAAFGLA